MRECGSDEQTNKDQVVDVYVMNKVQRIGVSGVFCGIDKGRKTKIERMRKKEKRGRLLQLPRQQPIVQPVATTPPSTTPNIKATVS